MPFYEYECKHCGHALEAMQKVSDAPLRKCPACGKSQLQRLMSAPVFRLKGGGWYETDFKSDKEDRRNLADRAEGKDEKKETAETTAKESAEGAKAAEKTDKSEKGGTPADKPADKQSEKAPSKTVVAAPGRKTELGRSAGRADARRAKPAARPAARAAKPVKRTAKSARRR